MSAEPESDPEIPFMFEGKVAMINVSIHANLVFTVFYRVTIFVLLGPSSSSLSTSAGTNEDAMDLGAVQSFLGYYGIGS